MAAKKDSAGQFLLALLLGIAVGSGGMFLNESLTASDVTQLDNNYATVMHQGGILVFIGATPANNEYELLDEVSMDGMLEIIESGNEAGKGKFWKKLFNDLGQAYQNVSFSERVSKIANEAKSKYPDAEAIIFGLNFRTASIIKFK